LHNTPATSHINTLSLHDALPIYQDRRALVETPHLKHPNVSIDLYQLSLDSSELYRHRKWRRAAPNRLKERKKIWRCENRKEANRSEEHTSELQSPYDLVCRLLLE